MKKKKEKRKKKKEEPENVFVYGTIKKIIIATWDRVKISGGGNFSLSAVKSVKCLCLSKCKGDGFLDSSGFLLLNRGCPGSVMVKVQDYGIVVSEFKLQPRYYVHFRTNNLGKGMNPRLFFWKDDFGIE